MKLSLVRFSDNGESTLGLLLIDGEFFCYTIEDTHRDVKVYGQTRIPAGRYPLSKQRLMTPKTARYRRKFPWFEWHILVKDVPNFSGIYIHIGNDAEDTRGCILVGKKQDANTFGTGFIHRSTETFKALYRRIYKKLDDEDCIIEIFDLKDVYVPRKPKYEPSDYVAPETNTKAPY